MNTAPELQSPALSADELELLLRGGTPYHFARGERIFSRGERGDCMYVIEQGQVEIYFDDGVEGKVLGPGDSFGEIALLAGGSVRTASAYSTADTQVYVIRQPVLAHLREVEPLLVCSLLQRTCAYLLEHEHELLAAVTQADRELEQTLDYLARTRAQLNASELQANTDELTGLYNRRCFNQELPRYIEQARSQGRQAGLLLIDLDKFKPVNDTYGHAAGDIVLKRLARVLREQAAGHDLPCRIGGDEFALLLADAEAAAPRAEALRQCVAELSIRLPPESIHVSVSIGGAAAGMRDDPASLFEQADRSLYAAKERGRNCAVWMDGLPTNGANRQP